MAMLLKLPVELSLSVLFSFWVDFKMWKLCAIIPQMNKVECG